MGLEALDWRIPRRPVMRPARLVLKASAADLAEIERLLNSQDNVAASIKRAFLQAVRDAGDRVDTAELTRLLQAGRTGDAIDFVNRSLGNNPFGAVAAAVSEGALGAGVDAAAAPALEALDFSFGATNPATMTLLQQYEFGLIRELAEDSRASVAAAIRDGVDQGINPIDVARNVRDFIGLTERQSQAVLNYRDALVNGDSAALQRALRDKRFDASVERALRGEGDLSQDKINRMVDRYLDRYLKYRSETIARTEGMRAVNRGNLEAWKQAVDNGTVSADQVVRFWMHSHDDRVRDAHLAIPDMNTDGVGIDEPFDSPLGPIMYPGDPDADPSNTINCRCTQIIRYLPTGDETEDDGQEDQ